MKEPSVIPNSVWLDTTKPLSKSKLKADTNADVCIVGAGIAGMTVAYLLGREGKKVIVLDDGPIGGGETGRTTAHLANALDDRYFEIERLHGERGSKLAAESHSRAIDQIEAIVAEEKLDCDFSRVDGYLFVPPGDDLEILERELQACHRAGLSRVRRVPRAPLKAFDTGECLHFPRQAQFHPLKYLAGLTKAIVRDGGRIFTDTHVTEMSGGEQARAATEDGPAVTAQSLVVATNTPILDMVTMHTKQAAYRTYVVGFRIPRASVPQALYWDTPDPYHYVRVQLASDAHDLLIVGGEDHKTGQADDAELRFQALQDWTRQRFPMAGDEEYRWSGQVMEPNDVLAFIGRNPGDQDNVFIVTGDSGNGMTHGTIAGMLLRDLICGRKNCWTELYDPARVTLRAAGEFAKENLNVAAQYGDLVTGGDVDSSDSIEAGSGAILRRGLKKIAAYRDEKGKLHEFSAYCPHLGCVVAWNSTERSWDCPCHGSRFEALGAVINGPAIGPLSR